jgi:hypothetical protein
MTMKKPRSEWKPMGRPPKRAAEKQSECVMVRLTLKERRTLEAEAKRAGMPLASYIKRRPWRPKP